jgi:hypothetical protein
VQFRLRKPAKKKIKKQPIFLKLGFGSQFSMFSKRIYIRIGLDSMHLKKIVALCWESHYLVY